MLTTYYYGYRRNRLRRIRPAIAIILLLAVLFRLLLYLADSTPATGASKHVLSGSIINWSDSSPRGILQAGIPMMAWAGEAENLPRMVSPSETVKPLLGLFTLDRQQPLHMLQSQMPFGAADFVSDRESVAVAAQESFTMPLAEEETEEKTSTTVLSEANLLRR